MKTFHYTNMTQIYLFHYINLSYLLSGTDYSANEKMTSRKLRKKDLQSPQVSIKSPIIKEENKNAKLKLINFNKLKIKIL